MIRARALALTAPAWALLFVFLVFPMLALLRISFLPGDTSVGASGFALGQYKRFLLDGYYFSVLVETLLYGVAVSLICLILGFPVGYSLGRLPAAQRRHRMFLVIMPLTLSLVVVVFGWLVLLGRNGLVNNLLLWVGVTSEPRQLLFNRGAVLLVLVQQFIPFMILSIMNVVMQIDPVLEQASASLRASRLRTFRKVVLPMAMPGILAGVTLVFVLTISAFVTPRLIGGSRSQMVGSLIFEQVLASLNWPFAAAMSFILLVVGLGVTLAANRYIASRMSGGIHAR